MIKTIQVLFSQYLSGMLIFDIIRYIRIKARIFCNPKKIWKIVADCVFYIYMRIKGVETSYGYVTLKGFPRIFKHKGSRIIIAKGVTLISNPKYNPAGVFHPTTIATISPDAYIYIGPDSGLSGATICCAKKVIIGEYVGIGANVSIFDTDFHAVNPFLRRYDNMNNTQQSPILIDDYAWIGAHSIVLKGTVIGKGAVVGAGSVVTKDVQELCIYAGNPIKFIKKIEFNSENKKYLFDPKEDA